MVRDGTRCLGMECALKDMTLNRWATQLKEAGGLCREGSSAHHLQQPVIPRITSFSFENMDLWQAPGSRASRTITVAYWAAWPWVIAAMGHIFVVTCLRDVRPQARQRQN